MRQTPVNPRSSHEAIAVAFPRQFKATDMLLYTPPQRLSSFSQFLYPHPNQNLDLNYFRNSPTLPMSTTISVLHSLSATSLPRSRRHVLLLRSFLLLHSSKPNTLPLSVNNPRHLSALPSLSSARTSVEHVEDNAEVEERWDFTNSGETEIFDFDSSFGLTDLKKVNSPQLEIKELDELPEQWRRSKLAWLCKELPAHKQAVLVRVLNAQRKWVRQEDATYLAAHCLRIRENETAFRVYQWMRQQPWFQFDFAFATKLADYLGKERKYLKCQEIFDNIINQGLVPSESTFHILTVAYLSSPSQGCLEQACNVYNRMIQLGGYKPRLSLHNSLFKALVSGLGSSAKHNLKQAEFVFHNLSTSGLEIHEDIYRGLIWLHSYQDEIDKERILALRAEMQVAGFEESKEMLVSILRVCSKQGDVVEAEKTWNKLLTLDNQLPSQAFVYRMQVYARVGEPMKSLEIFRFMQERLGSATVVAFHKVIEVLCKAQEIVLAESVMTEFIKSGMKPLMPSYIDLLDLYYSLRLHDKLESTFNQCIEKCNPNQTVYNIYLKSLVRVKNLDKAEEIFNQMYGNGAIGIDTRSCNMILRGYLSSEDYVKAEKIYSLMCKKKYDIEPPLMDKLDSILSLSRKVVKNPIRLKLTKDQREILIGLLLGGLKVISDEERKKHAIQFQFSENSATHSVLKRHIHYEYHEWLASFCKVENGSDDVPFHFTTIPHSCFAFYAEQFWPNGRYVIPKLINRWLSPRVLAYWYMYGGYRTSSGDILLKLKGSQEGVDMAVQALMTKSLDCRVRKKGKVFWIGLLGSNSTWFWKLVKPFIQDDLKDLLRAGGQSLNEMEETQDINFDSGSDNDNKASNYSE